MPGVATCQLDVNTTLPLVCICTLLSFLCGVGIGANDLSANFAMVVGSGSLNMRQAIIYCTIFELLGAAFMGGHVSSTIRNGIVDSALFAKNTDMVLIGMTCATFAAALWLYLSTVFGLPVSITHTVVGSMLGFAIFASGSFAYVKSSGLVVIVISWVAAPLVACLVTAVLFYWMRRDVFNVAGHSFERAMGILPYCLGTSLLVDFFFVLIEKPPIMASTFAAYVPLPTQYVILLVFIFLFCWAVSTWLFPKVAEAAMAAQSFVWESEAIRTEAADDEPLLSSTVGGIETLHGHPPFRAADELSNLSFFKSRHDSAHGERRRSHNPTPNATPLPQAAVSGPANGGHSLSHEPELSLADTGNWNLGATASGNYASASYVLSSMVHSDSPFVRHGGSVRLAPVPSSRSISPMPGTGRGNTAISAMGASLSSSSPATHPPRSVMSAAAAGAGHTPVRPAVSDSSYLPGCNLAVTAAEAAEQQQPQLLPMPSRTYGTMHLSDAETRTDEPLDLGPHSPLSVHSEDEFGEEDWAMDHPMQPIRFGGILIKPFNPRAEYLFTGLQVVAGSMSSFVHGAVAGANATATFTVLYDAFTNHELGEPGLSSRWSVLPAMVGIAIGMFGLGASLMKTVGMELVTVTPARGWCIQTGGTLVTMILTGIGIPVSLSQSQIGAAIGCGVLDARLSGVSWGIVTKVVTGWVVTLVISAITTGASMWLVSALLCL